MVLLSEARGILAPVVVAEPPAARELVVSSNEKGTVRLVSNNYVQQFHLEGDIMGSETTALCFVLDIYIVTYSVLISILLP